MQDDQGSSTLARKEKTEDLHETVRAGLRILARIIAREEIKKQLAEGEWSHRSRDPRCPEPTRTEVEAAVHVKNT